MADNKAYNICYKGGEAEITEKKSKFIATVRPVKSEQEAVAFIEETRKKYWDARHNCYAYITGDQGMTVKCSDDGEPSQTAGKPMMDILAGMNLRDVCVIVTRYFGGILLGTGGLLRAYQSATKAGLEASVITEKKSGYIVSYELSYELYPKLEYIVKQSGYEVCDTQFTDKVVYAVLVPEEDKDDYVKKVTELSSAKAKLLELKNQEYIFIEEKVIKL